MRIIVENFGPIKEADITLKDLTIFVGPGGTGKSYLAYLLWLLCRSPPKWKYYSILSSDINKISEYIEKNKEPPEEILNKTLRKNVEITEKALKESWKDRIMDLFRLDGLTDLIRKGSKSSVIKICNNKCTKEILIKISKNRFYVGGIKNLSSEFKVKYIRDERKLVLYHENKEVYEESFPYLKSDLIYEIVSKFYYISIPAIFEEIFVDYIPYYSDSYILTDGRAGILRAYKYMLGATLIDEEMKPFLNFADREMLRILSTLDLKIKDKKISSISDFLEEKIEGKFIVKQYDKFAPEIEYIARGVRIPLLRAHSGAREIAPLIIFMRYVLEEEDLIVVEEPEVHSHPHFQSLIARTLSLLSNYCDVLITTHSPIILDEIDNLIRLNKLNKKEKIKLGYRGDEGIDYRDVAIYRFKLDGTVEEVEISEEGIKEEEFSSVTAELFNRYADVEEILESKKISRRV